MDDKTVILARHGESEFSVRGAMNGDTAVPCGLTALGIEQARALGAEIASEPLELVVTSAFERAQQTANEALRGRTLPRLLVPELNDPRYGDYEGRQLEEFRAWAHTASSADRPGAGGESRFEIVERYARAFRRVIDHPARSIVVVSHSLPVAYVLAARDGAEPTARMAVVDYATAYRFSGEQLDGAVARLEHWLAAPTW